MSKNSNFCHLHVHSDRSLLDGLGKVSEYAKKAKEMNFQYMALSDHASVDNAINFQEACLKNDIAPIIGCELYLTSYNDFKGKSGHCTVFVKNETGWRNLCEILSLAHTKHFYKRPRVDFNILYDLCDGLCLSTACAGSFLKLDKAEEFFHKLHNKIGSDLYLEIMPHHLDAQDTINKKCLELNKKTRVKLISTTDAHYVNKEDRSTHDVLLAIQSKTTWDNPKRFRFNFEGSYLQSWDEILEYYGQRGIVDPKTAKKSLFNTLEIAEKCKDFRIKPKEVSLPDIRPFQELSSKENLKKLTEGRFYDRLGFCLNEKQEYKERLEMELNVICDKNFQLYFLIVEDILSWMRKNNIVTSPGRGSASGCLVSYVLGITEVDPIRHGLVFERFLNPERSAMPDIDLDIPRHNREQVRQYLIEKYGGNNIAGVSTFSYLKGRSVIRDVARVFSVPLDEVDVFAKTIDEKGENIILKASQETPEGIAFAKKYPKIIEYAARLEGVCRNSGQHAAAVIISSEDLTKSGQCNLAKRGDHIVVNWDMHDAEYSGLMKLDLLGLSQLSIIDECFKLIEETDKKKYTIKDFENLDDEKVFKDLSKGNTAGVFQMNTRTMTDYIKRMGIQDFNDMSACIALVRPGTADSGIADEYILRKHGKEWDKKHPVYEEITKDTFGLNIYQEQIMYMFTRMAGLSFAIADNIRKIISKKRDLREFDQYKDMFVEGCLKQKTFTKEEALQFWSELEASANYLFNKSHSVSYAYLSYVTSWLKIHYPAHFYCANLTMGENDKKSAVVKEAYNIGLKIKLPKVGHSKANRWMVKEDTLLAPFIEIKNFGDSLAEIAENELIPIAKAFQGFYKREEKKDGETKLKYVLNKIKAYDYNSEANLSMQDLFEFPISNDLSVICPSLLDIAKGKYPERHIHKLYSGDTYASLGLIRSVKRDNYEFECDGCSLHSKPFETVFGDKNIMIITEHPSYSDSNQNNKLFSCNMANEILMDLYEIGVPYEDITIAASVKCSPGRGKKPVDENKRACYKHLEAEIKHAQPKLILAMGRIVIEFFDAESRPSDYYGKFMWSEKYQSFIFFTYSLGYGYIGQENKEKLKKSLGKFYEMVKRNK